MSRSTKKGPFVNAKLMLKVQKQKERGKADPIKTWARASTITPEFVGQTPTRQFRGHGQEKKETAGAAPAPPPAR